MVLPRFYEGFSEKIWDAPRKLMALGKVFDRSNLEMIITGMLDSDMTRDHRICGTDAQDFNRL